jgi:hypothetical protein
MTFFSPFLTGFWRTTNSRDPSLPHCPRFQISRPCELPGTFLYPWLFTSFVIAGHIWWFMFRLFHLLFCALVRTPKEFPFVHFLCHLLCCLGNEMFVCSFVIGIWRRTSSRATSPDSSTGMKYCNTCKSSTSFCFAHLRTSFQVITFLLSWSSEAWGVIHWLELCHLICANWLACGTCKFTALLHCMYWCISCSLILLTLVAFHTCSDVRGNNLTGTIPEGIGNCTSFEILYVGSGDSVGFSLV